jgi:hypothetical protein
VDKCVKEEVKEWRERLGVYGGDDDFVEGDRYVCPMCPCAEFSRKQKVQHHVEKYHAGHSNGTPINKQYHLMLALFNYDSVTEAVDRTIKRDVVDLPDKRYLYRSARILQKHLQESPSWDALRPSLVSQLTKFDRHCDIVLDMENTRYILKADAADFHRLGAKFLCTDRFVSCFLAALVHPTTKGSEQRVQTFLRERCQWMGYLLPQYSNIFRTFCEAVLGHPMLLEIMSELRAKADKRIVGIDGQYSTVMSVLYQRSHGQAKAPTPTNGNDEIHVLLTVQCKESVLLVHPAPSEAAPYQLAALRDGLGHEGLEQVLLLFSDAPEKLDIPLLKQTLTNLHCIAKDPLHMAMKVEQTTGKKLTSFSKALRRCLSKLRAGCDDRRPYYSKGGNYSIQANALQTEIDRFTDKQAKNANS